MSLRSRRLSGCLVLAMLAAAVAVTATPQAPDISGKWTASFETEIGTQDYTYDLVVKDGVLTGKAKSNFGEGTIGEGKVDGKKVTFVEMLKFQDMELRIVYNGEIASADEISFTRQVADIATEKLVAKRAK